MNKSESTSILLILKKQLQNYLPPTPFIIIGVSGGADSMTLLYALHKLNVKGLVVHVNYGQRGAESEADQEFVEQISAMWGFECCSIRPEDKPGNGNFQSWARNVRYTAFEELRVVYNADAIAIAHNQDDQLETLLFKLLRGSGLAKLNGLDSWNENRNIWRPLLNVSKQEILDYCESEHIPFRTDASNNESKYARNAIRNDVFPVFEAFIPGWKENLIVITESAEAFEESINELLKGCTTENGLSTKALSDYSDRLSGALLKQFVESESGNTLSKGQIKQLLHLIEAETGKFIEIDKDTLVIKDRDAIRVKRKESDTKSTDGKIISKKEAIEGVRYENWQFKITEGEPASELFIDADSVQWPLIFRRWVSGDSFIPLGMSGTQKVSDHLTNRKIKSSNRHESLILCDSGGTICAILYPEPLTIGMIGNIAETNKKTELTTRYFSIEKL